MRVVRWLSVLAVPFLCGNAALGGGASAAQELPSLNIEAAPASAHGVSPVSPGYGIATQLVAFADEGALAAHSGDEAGESAPPVSTARPWSLVAPMLAHVSSPTPPATVIPIAAHLAGSGDTSATATGALRAGSSHAIVAQATEQNAPAVSEATRSSTVVEAVADPTLKPMGFASAPRLNRLPNSDFIPIDDRHRIGFPFWQRYPAGTPGEYVLQRGRWWDPYNQNVLKGDYPIVGENTFLTLNGLSDTASEFRRIPRLGKVLKGAFVGGDQTVVQQNFVTGFDLLHGESVFKPADWELRFTPVFNLHYLDSEKDEAKPPFEHHLTQRDAHVAIQELFAQYKIADVSPWYDTISIRGGIQGFVSDFRGFIFADNEPGVRLFGSFESNRDQWNLAYFSMLDKDTFTGLNTVFHSRDQNVFIANYTRQDFIWDGYFAQLDFLFNNDNPNFQLDDNHLPVRPANFFHGLKQHGVNVGYLGFTGDGHIGRINIDHAFYEAYGRDSFNGIAGHSVTVNARMAALEASIDRDWLRYKASFLYASGDGNPHNRQASGFDGIIDNPNFAGDGFSFWNREGVPLPNTGVNLVNRFSLYPSLKPSLQPGQAQSNFVNPGLWLYNAGIDAHVTPRLFASLNVNFIQFDQTGVLETIENQAKIGDNVGLDYSLGFRYKPLLIDNVILTTAVAAFTPMGGFRDIYGGQFLFMGFGAMDFVY
jgi:hypothetical protein